MQELQALDQEARAGLAVLALPQLARLDDALVAGAGDGGRLQSCIHVGAEISSSDTSWGSLAPVSARDPAMSQIPELNSSALPSGGTQQSPA